MDVSKRRLFVGNLPSKVSQSAIKKKLSRFGNVLTVETKQRNDTDGNVLSSFAFVDIETDSRNLDNCFEYFENELWNSERVKVQLAKESFLERLKREQNSLKKPAGDIIHASGESETSNCKLILRSEKCHTAVNLKMQREIPCEEEDQTRRRQPLGSPLAAEKGKKEFSNDFIDGKGIGNISIKSQNNFEIPFKIRGLPMFAGTKIIADLEDKIKGDDLNSGESEISARKLVKRSENLHKESSTNLQNEITSEEKGQRKVRHQSGTSKTEKPHLKLCGEFVDGSGAESKINERENSSKISYRDKSLPLFTDAKMTVELDVTAACSDLNVERAHSKKSISDCGTETTLGINFSPEKYDWSINSRMSKGQECHKEKRDACTPESQLVDIEETTVKAKSEKSIKKMRKTCAVVPQPVQEKQSRLSEGRGLDKSKNEVIAEQKRLNALEERKKAFALQKDAVKKALSSIDSKTSINKKIIFDMDESDEETTYEKNEKIHSTSTDNAKPKLFDDSSDDEELMELDSNEFKIKPQFEGPRGQKLLAIQSRYANDSRFKLDERFHDDDEDKSGQKEEAEGCHSEEDLGAEKNHQLRILQDMLGVDVSTRKPNRDKPEKKRDSLQMVRFDPTNPEHSRYLVTEEELKKKQSEREVVKKRKKGEMENEDDQLSKKAKMEEEPVPVVKERYYKVSDRLKESLKKRSEKLVTSTAKDQNPEERNGGFSLLKKFGAAPVDHEKDEAEYSTKAITRDHKEWEKNPFRYDSSDEEEEEPESLRKSDEVTTTSESKPSVKILQVPQNICERFYFHENDPRLQEGLEFFTVKKSFSEMQEGFHERRADLKLIIRGKVRNNKRRNRPIKKKLGGAKKHKKRIAKR